MGASVAMIPLLLRASRSLWIGLPLYVGAVAWNNWLVASLQGGHGWLSAPHLSTLGLIVLLFGAFLSSSCRTALLQPSKRWWLTPCRKKVELDARICPVLGGEVLTKTFDISEGGIFLTIDHSVKWLGPRFRKASQPEETLRVGSYCWLRIALNEVSALSCNAEIVRKADARGIYPAGIGLRFMGLTAQEKKTLTTFLNSIGSDKSLADTLTQPHIEIPSEQMAA
jgi:hypothetical protein